MEILFASVKSQIIVYIEYAQIKNDTNVKTNGKTDSTALKLLGLLNESHPRIVITITMPLFRVFEFRLVYLELVLGKVKNVNLGYVRLS